MEQHKPSAKWFIETQSDWFIQNGIPEWFHGVITRKDAEDLLKDKPLGCFLIRVSESRIGYSLSYRAQDRFRHFMIEALKEQQFSIVGDTRVHRTLDDLVKFHTQSPLYPYNEILTQPCGQKENSATDYEELFEDRNIFTTPFQQAVQTSLGATLHSVVPPVKPRKSRNIDTSSQNMSLLCNPPPSQSENRLYPAIPEMSLSSSSSFAFSNQQPATMTSNSVEPSFPNAACPINNIYEEKQDITAAKPIKACRNAVNRAVSLVTEGDIAQDFKRMENAMATHMKSVKNSFGRLGQPIQKNSSPSMQQNSKCTYMPEEYKKPPPFAPGFC